MAAIRIITQPLAGVALAVILAGCSSGSAGLSTGALFGTSDSSKSAAPVVAPETPADRALHVGATTARAKRCGYVFDPNSVRSAYLAFEVSQGAATDTLARTEKEFDYTVQSVGKNIAGNEDYCSDEQTSVIKRDLTNVLAGNFSAPTRKVNVKTDNWWGSPSSNKAFDREEALKTKDAL